MIKVRGGLQFSGKVQKAGFILGPKRQPGSEEVEESRVSRQEN
jgi:hypothetical protein